MFEVNTQIKGVGLVSESPNPDDLGELFDEIGAHLSRGSKKTKYVLRVPPVLMEALKVESSKRRISASDLVKKFFRLGLLVCKFEDDPSTQIIIRKDGEDEIELVLD